MSIDPPNSKKSGGKKSREKLRKALWPVLTNFNSDASILRTRQTSDTIMKLVKKYCRFRNHDERAEKTASVKKSPIGKKASDATNLSSSVAKAPIVTKPFIPKIPSINIKLARAEKTASVTKSSIDKKPLDAKKSSSSAAIAHIVAKSIEKKPSNRAAEFEELENELRRLSDSAGFVTQYPIKHKRVPKPVERFSSSLVDSKRTRQSLAKRQNDEIDKADQAKKKKRKGVGIETVHGFQKSQTISSTTSTTGSYHLYK